MFVDRSLAYVLTIAMCCVVVPLSLGVLFVGSSALAKHSLPDPVTLTSARGGHRVQKADSERHHRHQGRHGNKHPKHRHRGKHHHKITPDTPIPVAAE